jgi:hypothetical protein
VRYAEGRAGLVSFSLRAGKRHFGYRSGSTANSLSLVKAMLMVAYLSQRSVRGRPLHSDELELLGPMIRRSDNQAASAILGRIGTGPLVSLARRAGMQRFAPATPVWGASTTCAADQSRFFRRIGKLLPRRHRDYALGLLASIVPRQRWGVASLSYPGWTLYFKSGWGSGSGAAEHQVALLRRGNRRVSLAILTVGNPNAAYARQTQRGIAARLLRRLRPRVDRWRERRESS